MAAHLSILHDGLICIAFCMSVCQFVYHWIMIHISESNRVRNLKNLIMSANESWCHTKWRICTAMHVSHSFGMTTPKAFRDLLVWCSQCVRIGNFHVRAVKVIWLKWVNFERTSHFLSISMETNRQFGTNHKKIQNKGWSSEWFEWCYPKPCLKTHWEKRESQKYHVKFFYMIMKGKNGSTLQKGTRNATWFP